MSEPRTRQTASGHPLPKGTELELRACECGVVTAVNMPARCGANGTKNIGPGCPIHWVVVTVTEDWIEKDNAIKENA